MTGIIDYGAGNVRSVERALDALGVPSVMSADIDVLSTCNRLIVPGVGEASYAMRQLQKSALDTFIAWWVHSNKPLMGICLGSQIIFDHSDEGDTQCLGLVHGNVRHFNDVWQDSSEYGARQKVPHIGWNNLNIANGGTQLLKGNDDSTDYYFVHSYVMCPSDESVVKAYTDYGCAVPAVVESGSVTVFQFHPEKSGAAGLNILRNFCASDNDTLCTNGGALC